MLMRTCLMCSAAFARLHPAELACASDYTFINIADNTGTLGNQFSNPAINENGVVVFGASIGGGDTGIFTGQGGPLTTIVLGGDDNFNVSAFVDVNDSGQVCVRVMENISEGCVCVGNGGSLAPIVITDENPFQSASLPSINNAGQVSFYGHDSNGSAGIRRAQGLGNYTTIAELSGNMVSFTGRSEVNASGQVAFHANTTTGNAVYIGDGAALDTVIETDDTFTSIGSVVSFNDNGTVAFFAGSVALQGVHYSDGVTVTTIADSAGAFAPFSFNDVCINNHNDVAFYATPDKGTRGIFTGPDPEADKVIQIGDPLFGSTVSFFPALIGPNAINDDGDITFVYFLEDGRTGVAVAQAGGIASPPGDLNGDAIVDTADLLILLGDWGPCQAPCPPACNGDLNADCTVDVIDLLILLQNWT